MTVNGPPFRIRIISRFKNKDTGIAYMAEGTGSIPFAPFPGLIIDFPGGYRIPFKGTTKVHWDGKEFKVETTTQTISDETEAGFIKMLVDAHFYVWWPYDRQEHLKRVGKPKLILVSKRDES